MDFAHIYFIYFPVQFVEYTFHFSLENLAKKFQVPFTAYTYGEWQTDFDRIPTTQDKILVFFIHDVNRPARMVENLLGRCPNAVLVQFGGDTHYLGVDAALFTKIHIHLDTMYETVKKLKNELGLTAYHFYWTISETFIKQIQEDCREFERDNTIICLCNTNTHYRRILFEKLQKKFKVLHHLREFNPQKLIEHYKRSIICLGTSSPCINDWTKRSNKGFRDWIAPFCGTLLIYDDIEEIRDIEIVPTFKYGSICHLYECVDNVLANPPAMQPKIEAQRKWALENTLEKQFEKILTQAASA
jgi:hypothetical protein